MGAIIIIIIIMTTLHCLAFGFLVSIPRRFLYTTFFFSFEHSKYNILRSGGGRQGSEDGSEPMDGMKCRLAGRPAPLPLLAIGHDGNRDIQARMYRYIYMYARHV